jgi:TPR repeat protein
MNYFSAKRFLMTTAVVALTANVGLGMLESGADQGHADAQFNYATFLLHDRGDGENAARYFKMAADQGHAGGQNGYGMCLDLGIGVPTNEAEGVRYYGLAAAQGHADAQFNYATCLHNGTGVAKNAAEAARYHKQAADQGSAVATNRLNTTSSKR